MFGLDAAGFAGPPVLAARSISNRCEVVVRHHRGPWIAALVHISSRALPPARLAQLTGAEALLELFFVDADRASDADYAVGRYLALPDPEINGIHRNPESLGNFAHLCKISEPSTLPRVFIKTRAHRTIQKCEFALVRFSSHYFQAGST
jgi:hypothetical protein